MPNKYAYTPEILVTVYFQHRLRFRGSACWGNTFIPGSLDTTISDIAGANIPLYPVELIMSSRHNFQAEMIYIRPRSPCILPSTV